MSTAPAHYLRRSAPSGPGNRTELEQRRQRSGGDGPLDRSRLRFTLWLGMVTEVYWLNTDRPQIRDRQFVVTAGATSFTDERHLNATVDPIGQGGLGYRLVASDTHGRFRIEKPIISNPEYATLRIRIRSAPAEVTRPVLGVSVNRHHSW